MLKPGIYEQVIDQELSAELKDRETDIVVSKKTIDEAEAAVILSRYAKEIIERELITVKEHGGGLAGQIEIVNRILSAAGGDESNKLEGDAEQLLALIEKENSSYAVTGKAELVRPETSVAHSSLFTGAIHEPSMFTELKKEILSADRIDMLVSFVKWSGLRLIMDELKAFTQRGGILRIITTSYMGATDIKAVEELRKLPNTRIKISYDTKRTRLHAKTYVFYRDTGFTTAYIGSSNLSNAAISSGLEWNVKITAKDLPETVRKVNATFESYWNSSDFETYNETECLRLEKALKAERGGLDRSSQDVFFDILPFPYQQEILDKLRAEREIRGHYKNLIVAATGTGKTVISAFDYRSYCKKHSGKVNKLLFVAHREEILEQSIATFRAVLKDNNFGELSVGNYKAESIEHLFISIQTFNSKALYENTSSDYYDYIIVDEFHHAAAPTYQKLLTYYRPKVLLGLTATPERMDGKSIVEYFDNRIAAEIRLPEAIDRKLLCPFQYFGITDDIDLSKLKWSRGGYDTGEITRAYTMSGAAAKQRAELVIRSVYKYVNDIDDVKGLGFCVSVKHAEFMSDIFNNAGIASVALSGESDDETRKSAKERLVNGELRFIFVVDIYNEGVDIPEVNTVLFLRPTESVTVFLQQLGRGLRISENKDCLTVLDFIGQANKKYNFEDKFAALLSNASKSLSKEIKEGFSSVPKGCYIHLEKLAKEYIYNNIRSSFDRISGLTAKVGSFTEDTGLKLTLANFLSYYHLDPRLLYKRTSFSRLCVTAGVAEDFNEELEGVLTKALPRICVIDSRRFLRFIINMISDEHGGELTYAEIRMLKMFNYTVWNKTDHELGFAAPEEGIEKIKECPRLSKEIIELLRYNYDKIDFIDEPVELGFDCPLDLYCSYSKAQLLLAMDVKDPASVREGVKYLSDKKADVFMVTLNKSDKDYSPSTMYNDYSINSELFHWQSQSTTTPESPTGQRYVNHKKLGNRIMLFVRENKKDQYGLTANYTFLGLADFMQSAGSAPMNIVWKLHRPIPAKYLKKTNKLVV
ncbi:MAG TPA: DUF3427 domain-containing protein [Candidatus Ornithomonoglobus merdipullorum]|uniref:DUF3427 domain-containing protein n=1 Tax=Candidatus Ornithomonoglobus merdipullorum TaxID=2840895 RepID=A0A9D1MDX8_9FIRM|nr:DUF3427 domain-containing protein [Candidatus Ornithomonoglobus merdipullorum]